MMPECEPEPAIVNLLMFSPDLLELADRSQALLQTSLTATISRILIQTCLISRRI
jgi:hypothetical protein